MKRGLYKAHAVVLNSVDYGESDRILTFYTKEYGKIKGIAKGARRSRKRFVGNIDPLCHIMMGFFVTEKSELARVEDASLIEGFNNLKIDIERLSEACCLLELTSEMTREGQVMPQVYASLTFFLRALDSGEWAPSLSRFFEIRLLSILGFLPHLDGCVACRADIASFTGNPRFSSDRGGLLCPACSNTVPGLLHISAGTARLLSMAARFDGEKLKRLKSGPGFIEESEAVLYDFIRHQLGRELKTKKFMHKLKTAAF